MTDNTYHPDEIARDFGETVLPDGVEHGSYRAAMRTDCTCQKCRDKRAKIRKRNLKWRS